MQKRLQAEELKVEAQKIFSNHRSNLDFDNWKNNFSNLLEELSIHQLELELQNEELAQTQQKLQNEKEKYQDLYDFAPIAYLTINDTGNILQLNFAAARMFGKPLDTFQLNSIFPFLAEESKNSFRLMVKNAFAYGSETGELIFVNPNQELIHTKVQLLVFLEKEIYQELCWVTITDITAQKLASQALQESEHKFRSYVESANDIVYSLTEEGIFTYISPNITESLGYKAEELLEKSFIPIVHPEDVPKCMDFLKAIVEKKEKQSGVEYRVRHKFGGWRWHTSNASPLLDENGNFISYLGISHDITERINTEQELRELNATKDKFLSIISHDLKGPIGGMMNILDVLKNPKNSGEEQQKGLEIAHQSAKQTYTLLEDLLLWSRAQTKRIQFNPQTIDIFWFINDIVLFQKYVSADKKEVSISTNLHDENVKVFADPEMVKIVIRNLLTNAVKFSHPGGKITIGSSPEDEKVLFYVSDNGIGIPKQNQEKLFKIEENFSTKGTNDEKGTGLGLILCKEFVERNGGSISVESEEGRGSKFFFTLNTKPFCSV